MISLTIPCGAVRSRGSVSNPAYTKSVTHFRHFHCGQGSIPGAWAYMIPVNELMIGSVYRKCKL